MKKLKLFLLIIFLFSYNSFSQSTLSLGLKVGFNSSKMTNEFKNVSDIANQSKTGYLFGVFVRVNLPVIYLQPELYYTKKGGSFQSATLYANQVYTQQTVLNTIDIPLLFGIKLINLKVINLRLMAGPVASFIISKNINKQLDGVELSTSLSSEKLKEAIWGIQAGAGIDVLNFSVDVRYEWGLNNISEYSEMNTKTRLLNVSLGLKIF